MDNLYLIIIGMTLVTYLPRAIPFVFLQNSRLHPKLERFLSFIPYTILGALIFPGIITSTGILFPAIIGGITALTLSWFKVNLLFVVLGSILATTLIQLL